MVPRNRVYTRGFWIMHMTMNDESRSIVGDYLISVNIAAVFGPRVLCGARRACPSEGGICVYDLKCACVCVDSNAFQARGRVEKS